MGRAIAVRTDYRSGDIRRIAQRVKNAAQARRLLAIATVLDGAARQEARKERRHGPADAAGLGDPVQRAGAGRSHQQGVAGCAGQADKRT
jgi:hypothetical protein